MVEVSGNLTRPGPLISKQLKQKPKDALFLNCELAIFQSNRPDLASTKSIKTGIFFNNFSINWLLWALYLWNYQSYKSEIKIIKITAMLCFRPYKVFIVIDRSQRARFYSNQHKKHNLFIFHDQNISKTIKATDMKHKTNNCQHLYSSA